MLDLDLQVACDELTLDSNAIPTEANFSQWVTTSLAHDNDAKENDAKEKDTELTIRIVDPEEIQNLNLQYRQKNKATNVLSFPSELPDDIPVNLLGDIIICPDVVVKEANTQNKPLLDHWAHMVVHGTLHLLGYDHENDKDADIMESKEIDILRQLGFNNPYT